MWWPLVVAAAGRPEDLTIAVLVAVAERAVEDQAVSETLQAQARLHHQVPLAHVGGAEVEDVLTDDMLLIRVEQALVHAAVQEDVTASRSICIAAALLAVLRHERRLRRPDTGGFHAGITIAAKHGALPGAWGLRQWDGI